MPDYVFDFTTIRDGAPPMERIEYTCHSCGALEHGGGVPNPGLYARMRAHLRESHSEGEGEKFAIRHIDLSSSSGRVEFERKPSSDA